jgi:hypothetical protein
VSDIYTDLHANPWGLYRVDGTGPYNGHFWPMRDDEYRAYEDLDDRRIEHIQDRLKRVWIVGLQDGRWMSQGHIYKQQFFATREAALRSAVARYLRLLRYANRKWKDSGHSYTGRLPDDLFEKLVEWAYSVLGRAAPKVRASGRVVAVRRARRSTPSLMDFV